jgi:hypothetical protein
MTALAREHLQLRPDVVAALKEQPRLYVAAAASLARGSRKTGGRPAHGFSPPSPISEAVHDLIVEAEWTALQLNGRFRLVLGYSLPWGRLRDACPWCGMWSLVHKADDGVIRCGNPGCVDPDGRPPVWRGRGGWLELAALLAAQEG